MVSGLILRKFKIMSFWLINSCIDVVPAKAMLISAATSKVEEPVAEEPAPEPVVTPEKTVTPEPVVTPEKTVTPEPVAAVAGAGPEEQGNRSQPVHFRGHHQSVSVAALQ